MKYKVKLTLTEQYETEIEANSEDEAYNIANDMDIAEYEETGIITQDMNIEKGQG